MHPQDSPLPLCSPSQVHDPTCAEVLGLPCPTDTKVNVLKEPLVALDDLPTPGFQNPDLAGTVPDAIPSAPGPVSAVSETPTPLHEGLPDLDIVSIVGSALPPKAVLPTPPTAKAARDLRLPSFEMLGIAAPHPDRIPSNAPQTTPWIGAGPLSQPSDPLHLQNQAASLPIVTTAAGSTPSSLTAANADQLLPGHRSIQQYIVTQTPPDDAGKLDWTASDSKTATVADQSPRTQQRPASSLLATSAVTTPAQEIEAGPHRTTRQDAPWLKEALPLLLDNVSEETSRPGQVTILSQALPVPSSPGHAFPAVIQSIHSRIQPHSMVWINVFHAVPGTLNLADLPTSPPSTPASPHEGEDYFTTKIFDSAVAVPDYQASAPNPIASPRPAVPPGTIDISIVERYIPPTNSKEFEELFFDAGRSLLSDRLVELSPNNGTLLFVYPTRCGGRTFVNEYLGPILEPILRTAMVIEKLGYSLIDSLGSMPAVDSMMTFEDMDARMAAFCRQLCSSSTTPLHKFHNKSANYTLLHSSKQLVQLDKATWAADWWIKQEKPRIREAVKTYFATLRRPNDDVSPLFAGVELVERILKGVRDRRYPASESNTEGTERKAKLPATGIEVGVFVIQKSTPNLSPPHDYGQSSEEEKLAE